MRGPVGVDLKGGSRNDFEFILFHHPRIRFGDRDIYNGTGVPWFPGLHRPASGVHRKVFLNHGRTVLVVDGDSGKYFILPIFEEL